MTTKLHHSASQKLQKTQHLHVIERKVNTTPSSSTATPTLSPSSSSTALTLDEPTKFQGQHALYDKYDSQFKLLMLNVVGCMASPPQECEEMVVKLGNSQHFAGIRLATMCLLEGCCVAQSTRRYHQVVKHALSNAETSSNDFATYGWMLQLAKSVKSPILQLVIADCLSEGKGCFKDIEQAFSYWQRIAKEYKHRIAQFNLGLCYLKGEGTAKDLSKAVENFQLAAQQGFAEAQFNMGVCYTTGCEGVLVPNAQEAAKYFKLAAVQGFAQAQYNLGLCYLKGTGVECDKSKAIENFRHAAMKGIKDAQKNWNLIKPHCKSNRNASPVR